MVLFNNAAARNMLDILSEDVYNTILGRNHLDRKYLNNQPIDRLILRKYKNKFKIKTI